MAIVTRQKIIIVLSEIPKRHRACSCLGASAFSFGTAVGAEAGRQERFFNFSYVIQTLLCLFQQSEFIRTSLWVPTVRPECWGWSWAQCFSAAAYPAHGLIESCSFPQLHSDMDRGDGSIKYILSGEGAGIVFTIDDTTGDIHAIQRLDREERSQYTLRAQALDRRTGRPMEPESEFIIKIQDINDNEPKFLDGPYVASVPEMSPVGKTDFVESLSPMSKLEMVAKTQIPWLLDLSFCPLGRGCGTEELILGCLLAVEKRQQALHQ